MPTFETAEPISVDLQLGVGGIRIAASDRTDTVVLVRPTDSEKKGDVTAAEQTLVEYAGGRLVIKAPKGWRQYSWRSGGESVDVEIALPLGSRFDGEAGVAALRSTGRLGECRYKTGVGGIHVDEATQVWLRTGAGDVTVDHVAGRAEITTGSGVLHVGGVAGPAIVKNSNGDTWIGEVAGDLRANAASGRITIDRPQASVVAKTAKGDIRLGTLMRGETVAETGFGKVEIGIGDGVAAWLELNTSFGNVCNDLEATDAPAFGEAVVEVRARTGFGDIAVHRSPATEPARAGS